MSLWCIRCGHPQSTHGRRGCYASPCKGRIRARLEDIAELFVGRYVNFSSCRGFIGVEREP